jgi:hypothetical protein
MNKAEKIAAAKKKVISTFFYHLENIDRKTWLTKKSK